MRFTAITILALFILVLGNVPAQADSKRPSRGYRDYGKTGEKTEVKKDTKKEVSEDKESREAVTDGDVILEAQDILLKMLAYESSLGILDCSVDVVEVTKKPTTNTTRSVRKEIYFLAPTRTLTLKDNIPIYYVDEYLFSAIIRQVELELLADETINGTDCYVIKMTPREEAFAANIKHYYLAKDDFRKIRIESKRFRSTGENIFNVTDFKYHIVEGMYLLPLNSESRTYDDRDFLLQATTSTFLHWKFNTGLTPEFFNQKLEGYRLYDVVK
ncbi:hypothetical protein J7L05_08810 [bacterium]|nr:hypothetical protein [bacterium]